MESTGRLSAFTQGLCFILLAAAFGTIEVLIGGTRMVFSLPSYALLGVLGGLAIFFLRSTRPAPGRACILATTLFFAYIIGRTLLSPVPYIARSNLYSALGGLVVYIFVACIFTRSRERMWFVLFLLVVGLGHSLVGTLQFRDGTNYMPISWLQRYDYESRASGFYVCPNHLAGYLEVVAVLGLSMVCWSRWPIWSKLLIGYAVAVCYGALILTGSRGGYLSAGASLAVFGLLSLLVLRRTSGGLAWKIGGAGTLVALLGALVVTYSVSRSQFLTGRAQNTFETTNMRVELWKAALEQWQLSPILGTGSATYLFYGRLFRSESVQRDPIHVHNDYLQLLAEYGLVGALGAALFLATHICYGLRIFARLGPKRVAVTLLPLSNALALNIGALAAVASYLVHSVFDFNLHIPGNVLLMAFVFGLLANEGVLRGRESPSPSRAQSAGCVALAMLGVLLLALSVRLFPGEYYSERARAAVRDSLPAVGIVNALSGLKYDPDNPDLHHRLGAARIQFAEMSSDPRIADSFRQAGIAAIEKAWAIVPQEEIYALELATALDRAGRFAEAEAVYYELFRLDPRSHSLHRTYEGHLEMWRNSGAPVKESEPGER